MQIAGIPIWLWIVGVIAIGLWLKGRIKPKETEHKQISLEKEVYKDVKNLFNIASEKIALKYKYKLRIGYKVIGIITKAMIFNWDYKKPNPKLKLPKETEQIKQLVKGEEIITGKSFYAFVVYKDSFIGKIKHLFKLKGNYFFIDKDLITISSTDYLINPRSQFVRYLGIHIFSQEGKEIVSDIAFKLTLEKALEETVNFIPKLSFLETRLAKSVAKLREYTELEKKKYDQKIEKMIEDE